MSVEGVAIQEPKTKKLLHQYPLHKISYCADDKAEKRFFSFIAKEGDTSQHTCFVFVSDKLVRRHFVGMHLMPCLASMFDCAACHDSAVLLGFDATNAMCIPCQFCIPFSCAN